jgi:enamine deaminase RidA (YjgF/YER057c/UK114 family)
MLPVGGVAVHADSVPSLPGFSSAIKRGLVMYISGQVPLDSAARMVGAGDLRAQTVQSVQNLLRVVRAGRGLPGDVAKLTFYVVDLDSAAAETVRGAAAGLFTEAPPPAVTLIGVSSLPGPAMRVAVDGVAVLRGEFPDRERTEGPMRQPE